MNRLGKKEKKRMRRPPALQVQGRQVVYNNGHVRVKNSHPNIYKLNETMVFLCQAHKINEAFNMGRLIPYLNVPLEMWNLVNT